MEKGRTIDYNNIPVHYCKHCISLNILEIDGNYRTEDFCDDCGSTLIGVTHIDIWEKMYKEKYGKTFLNYKKHGKHRQ